MTIGELRAAIAELDDALEIEAIIAYEDDDGDDVECSYYLESIGSAMDPDTAREYARFELADVG
jgi:hypothetical protein